MYDVPVTAIHAEDADARAPFSMSAFADFCAGLPLDAPASPAALPPCNPASGAAGEALECLLDALQAGSVVFALRATSPAPARWLTYAIIEKHLRHALMEPAHTQAWPLLPDTWAISMQTSAGIQQPADAMHVHTLCRVLAEHLDDEWRKTVRQNDADAPDAPTDAEPQNDAEASSAAPASPSAFTITPLSALRSLDAMEDNITELNALLDVLVNKQLHAQFQPIVNLRDGQVFGYEALIRGPKGGTLRRPGALFRAAHKARMVAWFDLACQEQCFALAAAQGLKHLLFINMEAEGLAYLDMHDRPLAARARDCGLSPASIVIEITERQAVEDFPRLLQSLAQLREQGFKIAIDDAGAGYSSLHVIAELRPDFVKIDRALVRNLDVNGERRALLAALVQYARSIGTHILAEGSETCEELGTLIDLGVTYGQGYLMGKPADTFRGVARETREFIQARQRRRAQTTVGHGPTMGDLARAGKTLPPDACIAEAAAAFYKNPSHTSIVVVEDGQARGLLMRQSLEHILDMARSARMEDLLPSESVAQWMQTTYLRADEQQDAAHAARQATTRTDLSLECDIVVMDRGGCFRGVVPMRILMEAVAGAQENRLKYADPLTGMPGRVVLEQELAAALDARAPLALLRVDLNGLTAYNRHCGLAHGDEAIRLLARVVQDATAAFATSPDAALSSARLVQPRQETTRQRVEGASASSVEASASSAEAQTTARMECVPPSARAAFAAHLGGGGFAVLTRPEQVTTLSTEILERFARMQPLLHTFQEIRAGGINSSERGGETGRAPLLACTVAAITNRSRRYAAPAQIFQDAEDLLRALKRRSDIDCAVDRLQAEPTR